jgi:hypothetical protein
LAILEHGQKSSLRLHASAIRILPRFSTGIQPALMDQQEFRIVVSRGS